MSLDKQKLEPEFPLWKIVRLEIHSHCNRDCDFCPRCGDASGVRKDKQGNPVKVRMPTAKVYSLLDEISGFDFRGYIGFHRLSEPLLDDRFLDFCRYARGKGMKILENTNGDLLGGNRELCREIDGVVNILVIGLYDYQSREEKERQMARWRQIFKKTRIRFSTPREHPKIRQNSRVYLETQKDERILTHPCFKTGNLLIRYDGEVSLCGQDDHCRFGLGNVFEQSLRDIWWSEKHRGIVRSLERPGGREGYALCSTCYMRSYPGTSPYFSKPPRDAKRREEVRHKTHINKTFLEVQKPFFKKVFGRRRQNQVVDLGHPDHLIFRKPMPTTAAAKTLPAPAYARYREPSFLVIGAQKCGTSSLYHNLIRHPSIQPAGRKEIHFFDEHYEKGMDWYRSFFPPMGLFEGMISGEASPRYFFLPQVPGRVARAFPGIKLILLLRNPVDRAYSQYHHNYRNHRVKESFAAAAAAELGQKADEEQLEQLLNDPVARKKYRRSSYLARGIYVKQLNRWLACFPLTQFLILKSEDFFMDPANTMNRVFAFLGLEPYILSTYARKNSYNLPPLDPGLREKLADYFRPFNRQLYDLLGIAYNWEEGSQ
jgi:radical SAM protein with 4Fe4S-binding SPASM domain